MSFQFPANPVDGDVVIRLINGQSLKGVYRANTNTWEVGELPEEPGVPGPQGPKGEQGDKGDPGQGLSASGIVDTYDDLPPPNDHFLQFWLVDDINSLFFSDGTEWHDLGSPITGPQGEGLTSVTANDNGSTYTLTFAGTVDSFNFTTPNLRGGNGAPGKGWYDTQLIDQRPTNYQISFLSNDGLEFTTDNIMGPKGDPGDMEVASEDNCGCIKVGRGLGIEPDGTLYAGQTYVDVETTPLPGRYVFRYQPSYNEFSGITYDGAWVNRQDNVDIHQETITIPVPADSDGCMVTWFQNSSMNGNPDRGLGNTVTGINTFMAFGYAAVDVASPGEYTQSNMAINFTHNVATHTYVGSVNERTNTIVGTKLNEVRYPKGTTSLNFTRRCKFIRGRHVKLGFGIGRLIVEPFRSNEDVDTFRSAPVTFNADIDPSDPEYIPPLTPNEILTAQADDLKEETREGIELAVLLLQLPTTTESEKVEIEGHLNTLLAARDLPGGPDEIEAAIRPSLNFMLTMIEFKYRFEP